ncbi:MAG: DUF885 domain-containing protein [Acidimicrobiia bacterium]|nr:DUF885 domain-containing protein [Acidimicrobiia bacterium]
MTDATTDIFVLSDQATDLAAAADPIHATMAGVSGHDHEWPDLSPAGYEQRADVWADIARRAHRCEIRNDRERLAQHVLLDECNLVATLTDAGEHLRNLNNIASPHQDLRMVFGSNDTQSREGWDAVLRRLESLPTALESYRQSLEEGRTRGLAVARRQVEAALSQGRLATGPDSSFDQLLAKLDAWGEASESFTAAVTTAVEGAKAAFNGFNRYLEATYAPHAVEADGVGRERYAMLAGLYLGTSLDLEETYRWGWNEVERLWAELQAVAAEIDSSKSSADVFDMLMTDPAYAMTSTDEFIALMKDRQLQALEQLDGSHFDVPEPIRTINVQVEPAGGASAASYVGPSEDFTRPGSIWYPIEGKTFLPLFQEITTAYHEGFPGHHLQVGVQICQGDRLSRFHRTWVWYPGSGEGWALYAERFMDELGYLERPEYRAGLLTSQLFRSCRVAIDIGAHLDLPIPDDVSFHPGESWTFDLAYELLRTRALLSHDEAESEVIRYLGWPGQAISYKVGEQAILDLREEHGGRPDFDLKTFHADLLAVGSVGLDVLRSHMGSAPG